MDRMRPGKRKARRAFSKAVMAMNGGYCVRCHYRFGRLRQATEPHHWLPLGRGGSDHPSNGLPLCELCHRFIHRFPRIAEYQGFLLIKGVGNNEANMIREWLERGKKFWA